MQLPFMLVFLSIFSLCAFSTRDPGVSEQIIRVAESLLGKPYKKFPLETTDKEYLVLQTKHFDCVTFVETVVTKVLASKQFKNRSEEDILRNIRYRDGSTEDYSCRLHYFTEWLRQAEKTGIGQNISLSLDGISRKKEIFFMTKHRSWYPRLANQNLYQKMAENEKVLSESSFHYIPYAKAESALRFLQNGDIIAFTSSLPGLDINHTGFIKLRNGEPCLLHASNESGMVEIHKKSFLQYLLEKPETDGFIVFRVNPDSD